jgi:DNA-binding GntR family transcriptional regulator
MIASVNKTDQIYNALLAQLLEGHYQFGEILSTYELASGFGVSRRPVMDAVMRLASAGFISIIPQVGCQVSVPDERKVREHFAVAGILEGAGAKLAAISASELQLDEIRDALDRGARPAARNDGMSFAKANREFHSSILAACGNERLSELAKQTWDLNDFYLQKNRLRTDLAQAQREHAEIVASIAAKDDVLAHELMAEHVSRFWTFVKA